MIKTQESEIYKALQVILVFSQVAKRTLAKTVQINILRILEINYRFGKKKRLNPSKNSECFAFKLTLIP